MRSVLQTKRQDEREQQSKEQKTKQIKVWIEFTTKIKKCNTESRRIMEIKFKYRAQSRYSTENYENSDHHH